MLKYITINPSDYRKNDFNIEGVLNSRWQVDFYNSIDEEVVIGTLHFTSYGLHEGSTGIEVYNKLRSQLLALLSASEVSQRIQYKDFLYRDIEELAYYQQDNPFTGFDFSLDETYSAHLKAALIFYNKITGKDLILSVENIDMLQGIAYNYYSSIKWLYYPFSDMTNTPCLKDLSDFKDLVSGAVKLVEKDPHSAY